MRRELKAIGNQERHTFIGEFIREGFKNSYRGLLETTILLRNIRLVDTNKVVTDHLWFSKTKGFEALNLKEGDIVQFDARVNTYKKKYKGYWDEEAYLINDYQLSYPTKLRKITKTEELNYDIR